MWFIRIKLFIVAMTLIGLKIGLKVSLINVATPLTPSRRQSRLVVICANRLCETGIISKKSKNPKIPMQINAHLYYHYYHF